MYKPKTIHYLFTYEYLADKYDRERPTGMCPDEWDMKILNCTPAQYFSGMFNDYYCSSSEYDTPTEQ